MTTTWDGSIFSAALAPPRLSILLSLTGLIVTMMLCQHMMIEGDTSAVGVFALAVGHGDDTFFPNHFYWTDYDPHTFTDLALAVPLQILSDYNPVVLKLTGYFIYLCLFAVVVFSVQWATEDRSKGMVAAGLFLSLAAPMTIFAMLITFHNSVIVLALVYLVLHYRMEDHPRRTFLLFFAGLLILYSDMIFMALFALPFLIHSLATRNLRRAGLGLMYCIAGLGLMMLKWHIGLSAAKGPGITPLPLVVYNVLTLPLNVFSMYFTSLWMGLTPANLLVFAGCAALFILIIIETDWKSLLHGKAGYLTATVGLGAVVMMAGYSMVGAFTLTRFLLYPALFLIIIIATGSRYERPHVRTALNALIVAAICLNLLYIITTTGGNQDEQQVIDTLRENNITYGYAWFHVSDPLTYLSKGDVKIMSSYPVGDNITISHWLNEENYIQDGGPACIITYKEPAWAYIEKHPANQTIAVDDYTLYLYDDLRLK